MLADLDIMQALALRVCLGLVRASTVCLLQVEAGKMSLWFVVISSNNILMCDSVSALTSIKSGTARSHQELMKSCSLILEWLGRGEMLHSCGLQLIQVSWEMRKLTNRQKKQSKRNC